MADSGARRPLRRLALSPLPVGAIRPTGWLARQLRIQADGLSGHLDEFWPDIARSGWIGGEAEGWERAPYWLDGLVPLAFLLDDAGLKAKVEHWVEYILRHQQADGWLGPVDAGGSRTGHRYDPWPRYPLLKALTQYQEATGDGRVIVAIEGFLRRLAVLLEEEPLHSWGHHRWADLVVTIYWLYDRSEPTDGDWLLDLAATCRRQGYDWRAHFADLAYTDRCRPEQCNRDSHVVNNAMGIKQPGIWYRQSHDEGDRAAVAQSIAALDTYHGQVTGAFSGDEHLAGRSPVQGTELCAIVEYMYSLEVLIASLGESQLADRLERLAFNCLPATCSPDMWTHQYDQQVNQVVCQVAEEPVYTSNGPEANLFGLEPNFGCCTANLHQGWPKLATHLWLATPDDGLAAIVYAPCRLTIEREGRPVRLTVVTDYPFSDTIELRVAVDGAASFPLHLRIPAWAAGARLTIDGEAADLTPPPGQFATVARLWRGETRLRLRLPMPIIVQRGYHQSVALSRGPLLYALRIGEAWQRWRGQPPEVDYALQPTTAWNYALQLDPSAPARALQLREHGIGDHPFAPEGAPLSIIAHGRRLPGWGLERHAAAPPPPSPVRSAEPLEELTLIPYGCTNLRLTEFPLLDDEQ